MKYVINAMGLVAWAFSLFVFFSGVAAVGEYEPGTVEYMQANMDFEAAFSTIGFGLVFGLGCFLVGALLKRKS